jgi:methyl halide transferase
MTGNSSPALLKLIAEGKIPNGRALIPGCGRGYDVVALASENRIATGFFY